MALSPYQRENPHESAEAIRGSANAAIAEIKARKDLVPEAKQERIERVKASANADIAELKASLDQSRGDEVETLRKRVFSPKMGVFATASDQIAAAASLRDALDRAGRADPGRESLSMLERAVMTSDPIQARAVLGVALERKDVATINAYIEAHPLEGEAIERYWTLSNPNLGNPLAEAFAFMGV